MSFRIAPGTDFLGAIWTLRYYEVTTLGFVYYPHFNLDIVILLHNMPKHIQTYFTTHQLKSKLL